MTAVAVGGKKDKKGAPGARTTSGSSGTSSGASAGVPAFLRSPDSTAAPAAPQTADRKGKKDDSGKKPPKGGAGDKGAAAPDAAPAPGGGGGASVAVEMLMPEPALTLAPDEKAAVSQVKDNARENADAAADLPPADAEVADARGAVAEPESETAARGQESAVAGLSLREPPSPEIEKLCDRIYEAIRAKRPPDEDDLVKAKPQEAADAAGSELSGSVQADTGRVEGSYGAIDNPPAVAPEQVPEGLEAPPPAPEVPVASAAAAAPDAVPAAEVSLDADLEASAAQMEEAGMNTPAAQLVKSGPIAEAREAQGELGEVAKQGPEEALAEQRAALGKASGEMAELQAAALARLAKSRDRTVAGTGGQKQEMVGTEEQMREAAGTQARDIFTQAQADVRAQLEGLPEKAMEKWEQGKKLLSLEFDQALDRVKKWIDERHSGAGGAVLSVVDYVAGLPDWVTEEYDRAEKQFGDGVCDLIREISGDVNTVVAACEQIVDDARADIKAVFDALPDSLQAWAGEQQSALGEQLDGLANEARETRDSFNKDLTERAATAVQEARTKIHELRQAAGGLLGRITSAIGRFLDDPLKFIIDGLLELVGIEPSRFWSLISRIQSVVADIVEDPLGFAGNLLAGIGQGFSQFFGNFGKHVVGGFFDWLAGGLAKAGVTLPTDFSLKGILTFVLQLMGITWERVRRLLAKHLGDRNIALMEKAWGLISTLIEKGPEGIFDLVKEKLDPRQIIDQIISAGVEFLVQGLVKAVSVRLLGMLNPAGAIAQAIEAIYRVISWVFQNAVRIFTLVEAVVNGMAQVVAGNISGMAAAVEGALAGLIAPVIDFLADYMGLGGLPDKIKGVIEGMQSWVEGIMATVIDFLAEKAKGLLNALGIGGKDKPVANTPPDQGGAGDGELGQTVPFTAAGKSHRLWVATEGTRATLMVASVPGPVEDRLAAWSSGVKSLPEAGRQEAQGLLADARALLGQADSEADALAGAIARHAGGASGAQETPTDDPLEAKERALARVLERLFTLFEGPGEGPDEVSLTRAFSMAGEGHHLYFAGKRPETPRVEMATSRRDYLMLQVGAALRQESSPAGQKRPGVLGPLGQINAKLEGLDWVWPNIQGKGINSVSGKPYEQERADYVELLEIISTVLTGIGAEFGIRNLQFLGHPSIYAEQEIDGKTRLKAIWRNQVRTKFYPSGYRDDAERWKADRLKNVLTVSAPAGTFRDEMTGAFEPLSTAKVPTNATIDHKDPGIAGHWNLEGHDQVQKERADFYNLTSNMRIVAHKNNASDGARNAPDPEPEVGPRFRGPNDNP